ncbi:TetR/AcrR family transcriptional regulator [Streptomyces alkaliterrae]|uniref:TetR family transcriptional regulator n=1 Tax=Streptomyces alkaliterrae TaxID=2213162 RepID=A0A5P0YRU2_9ACTN|nr:TetR/AcrR family transcriptional regulator [Streptomyces alkaliterrae]MBB1252521.1 TetR/AcrR family transcriptional regulator [Streptomyces alkaliterrae]MBB1261098.1 TetR/AcrR family transcriptional regulator [Streptomyces alkaliterrae]MQS02988.1 TetR family transcriptional regulator [Streptomyces alkaliterrae]
MGRTSTARERLLAATDDLMRHRGYTSLGVAEICAAAEVRKGSFYHFFDSKQALTLEVVDGYWTAQREQWHAALTGDGPALGRLRRLLEGMAAVQRDTRRDSGTVAGCLLGNLALELSTQEPEVRARLERIFDEQVELVATTLREAAEAGAVPHERATADTARAVIAQLEGLVLFAKLKNDPSVLDGLWPHTLLLVDGRE